MRLLNAEILKLVRRRGLMIWSLILTVGVLLVVEIILVVLHAVNADHHGPAGGKSNLSGAIGLLAALGSVAGILIASTAGTQDVGNGVFRDLVVTGRSRAKLFYVRVAGALSVFLPMLAAALALTIAVTYAFAGDSATPSSSYVVHSIVYAVLLTVINVVLAVGLAAFASSRVVVGVLIAWNAIVAHILLNLGVLGGARKLIDVGAAEHFSPDRDVNSGIAMSGATALIVLAVWAAVGLSAGRWWTERRDA